MKITDFGKIMVIVPHQDDELLLTAGVLYSGGEDANGFLSEAVVCSMPLDRASLAELYALWMNMDADSLVTADGSLLLLRGEEGLYIVS